MIYCCECKKEVEAKLVDGSIIYPHRKDLSQILSYQCEKCKNYVGVHKGTETPLGCIPTPEIREIRKRIHGVLDPLWHSGKISRSKLYQKMAKELGIKEYHTAEINSIFKANLCLKKAVELKDKL